jgi:hypothetical protein
MPLAVKKTDAAIELLCSAPGGRRSSPCQGLAATSEPGFTKMVPRWGTASWSSVLSGGLKTGTGEAEENLGGARA